MAYTFSCSSFSSSWLGWNYDIFLSFRGKDTRKNFTGHLYTALVQAGIHTFRDDNELSKGDDILRILNAIQQSKISIVVFSKGYASSTWCLDELSKIMECKRTIGQIVLPVFYDIDPSHVRQQTGPFAAAFAKHEKQFNDELEKVSRWKGALAEASNLSGWDLRSTVHGHQNKIGMHDLLRDMGREIVRERSPDRPGERSRIWLHEDAWNILQMQMGTNRVEGLILDLQQQSKVVCLSTKSFEQMNCLKLLQVDGLRLTGCYGHFSKELMWLCWHKCPLRSLPSDLELDNLSVLDMQHSNSKKLWKGTKFLNKLKILNLSYSKLLTMTPNLHSSSLEKLILEGCSGLIKVHQSIGHFERLVTLNLRGCYRLVDLPKSICCLKSLETLDVTQCSKLEKLPEQLGDMKSLTELLVGETAIKQLPSSIGNLKNLRTLSLGKCNYNLDSPSRSWLLSMISSCLSPRSANTKAFQPPSFAGLSSLRSLSLSYCGLSEDAISSTDFSSFSCLEEMNLKGNKFFNLPCGIGCLPMLRYLVVEDCKNLLSISELPTSLMQLFAGNCTSLERISIRSRSTRGLGLDLSGCEKLLELQDFESVTWRRIANNSTKTCFQAYENGKHYEMNFPSYEIPEWFSHVGDMYSSLSSFHAPAASESELQALLVLVVLELKGQKDMWFSPIIKAVLIARLKSSGTHLFTYPIYLSIDSHSWVGYIKRVENDCHQWVPIGQLCSLVGGEEWELSVNIFEAYVVKRVGVHLIY